MSLTQSTLKFLAARFHIPGDALDDFFASGRLSPRAETTLPFPAELIPMGARLVARGWMNNKFFPTNRDWILPFWAERQFDPHDPAFIPRGFNLYTINYTHRDWTMVGNLARDREAIVDPRGLVTPWFDGWSLDGWVETDGATSPTCGGRSWSRRSCRSSSSRPRRWKQWGGSPAELRTISTTSSP